MTLNSHLPFGSTKVWTLHYCKFDDWILTFSETAGDLEVGLGKSGNNEGEGSALLDEETAEEQIEMQILNWKLWKEKQLKANWLRFYFALDISFFLNIMRKQVYYQTW